MELLSRRIVAMLLVVYLIDAGLAQETCDIRYSSLASAHSACVEASTKVQESGVSDEDKQLIVDLHNDVRRNVDPPASDMVALTWDNSMANIAQKLAETCIVGHDSFENRFDFGRMAAGQNMAFGYSDWTGAVGGWAGEKEFYDYYSSANVFSKVGHYTQVVWAKSTRIGCGYAKCDTTKHYVCNYGPPGNYWGQLPYKEGPSCGECPDKCNGSLCDCGGFFCKNTGTLDLNQCSCSCYNTFFDGPDCTLSESKCNTANEYWGCQTWKDDGWCVRAENVPVYCARTCGWCEVALGL